MWKALLILLALLGVGYEKSEAETSLTIYNDDFAIVRDTLNLDLKAGVNEVRFSDVALYPEPSSVILRDPSGKTELQIQEQAFRGGNVTQETMLGRCEGQTIDFLHYEDGKLQIIQGKVIRSGRVKPGNNSSGSDSENRTPPVQPMIEVNGKLQFQLPGIPLFPPVAQNQTMKPEFTWKIATKTPTKLDAEIAYTAYAINWSADYNIITSEDSDAVQVLGWMTIANETGKNFENVRVKLVAGTIAKLSPRAKPGVPEPAASTERTIVTGSYINNDPKQLDEYYVYTHPALISVQDREQKQVQFLAANGVQSKKIYSYYGPANDAHPSANSADLSPEANVESVTRVNVVREFNNSADNHLGTPLPRGRMRFFRRSSDQELEFIGEYDSNGTPADEKVEATTGFAF